MNLKLNDRAVSCSNKEGDSIAVISGEKKSVKLLVFKHADIPFMQKGRGVTLQKFKSGKTYSAFCLDSNEGLKVDSSSKILINPKELKKWFGKRAQAGKVEPKNLHTKL